jgi:hypothetical protein
MFAPNVKNATRTKMERGWLMRPSAPMTARNMGIAECQCLSPLLGEDPIPHLRLGRYIRFRWGSPELEAWLKRRLFAKSLPSNTTLC